ncbi:hypothetical protein AB7008_41125 [Bradyrhizobium sp. 521_C7_N1_3]
MSPIESKTSASATAAASPARRRIATGDVEGALARMRIVVTMPV